MNVWQKRKCHNYRTFTLPRCRKSRGQSLRGHEASLDPGERSECLTNETDIEQRLKQMCSIRHACKIGLEGIVSKRVGFRDRSDSSLDWIKSNDLATPAVRREAEEDRER
jgi:hypothetical protein